MKRLAPLALVASAACPAVPFGVQYSCGSNSDCAAGQTCQATVCVPASSSVDAGGPADAGGSADAGPRPSTITGLAAGLNESCAIVRGGAQCWGDDSNGQLGNDDAGSGLYSLLPSAVVGPSNVRAIAVGTAFACAVDAEGGAWCWGRDSIGQLGDGNQTDSAVPLQVSGLMSGSGVTAVAAGNDFACAIVSGGVQCWGNDSSGELGASYVDGGQSAVPVPVQGSGTDVTALAAGGGHVCALAANGGVRCWGENGLGELGNGSGAASSSTPVSVSKLTGVQAIAAGGGHSCAIADGGVFCWGDDAVGELGDGADGGGSSNVPVPVVGLANAGVVQAIGVGDQHSCAVVSGAVWCWGSNSDGQLGNSNPNGSAVPVQVQGLGGEAFAVVGGFNHTCALLDGGVACWGSDAQGELGDGDPTLADQTTPQAVGPWAD